MTTSQLDRLMRSVLANLELTSGSKAGQMVQGSKDSDQRRAGPPWVFDVVGHFRRRYATCETDHERRGCIHAAIGELRAIRYGRDTSLHLATKADRLRIGLDPRSAHVVAHVFGISERHVRNIRAEARGRVEAQARP